MGDERDRQTANLTRTAYTDATVKNDVTYHYVLTATNDFGESRVVETAVTPAAIVNSGFESPKIGGFAANPLEATWTFTAAANNNGSGITANGSPYSSANPGKAPQGQQAAFLQGTATIIQTLGGLVPGAAYTLTFSAAQRVSSNQGGQTWQVKLGGKVIAEHAPEQTATAYVDYTVKFTATAASAVLAFVGTNTRGGDNTVFIDHVRLVKTTP